MVVSSHPVLFAFWRGTKLRGGEREVCLSVVRAGVSGSAQGSEPALTPTAAECWPPFSRPSLFPAVGDCPYQWVLPCCFEGSMEDSSLVCTMD